MYLYIKTDEPETNEETQSSDIDTLVEEFEELDEDGQEEVLDLLDAITNSL